MSKRVEVREGDKWVVCGNALFQQRGNRDRPIIVRGGFVDEDFTKDPASGSLIPPPVARAWIESLGGEWAEVAEEKKATTTDKTMHLYEYMDGEIKAFASKNNACENTRWTYLGTTTITIAGVTT